MEKNVGGMDRNVRLVVGAVLLLVGLAGFVEVAGLGALGTVGSAVVLVVGLVLLATALTRTCVINDALGINTFRGS